MYIKNIRIQNFRGIKDLTIETHTGLNVFVGPNNSGKTTILDAIRICTGRDNEYDRIRIKSSDFHIDAETGENSDTILLSFTFNANEEGKANFCNLVNIDDGTIQIFFKYELIENNRNSYVKSLCWGKSLENEGERIPDEILVQFKSTYLGALRDAEQVLEGRKFSLISQLMNNLEPDKDKQGQVVNNLQTSLGSNEQWSTLVEKGATAINKNLKEINFDGGHQKIDLNLLPFEFRYLTAQLHPQVPIPNTTNKYFEIYQNGLGENNLIYIATVLGNLLKEINTNPDIYKALIIEEPEAHLHPQLQSLLFSYLSSKTNDNIQVFISSHSPTITAETDIDNLIIIQKNNDDITSTSISTLLLENQDKKHIGRFLDVTKAQLFFATGVIFVEGITESLLLPIISKKILTNSDLIHKNIEVVNVGGISFKSFAKLFNSDSHLMSKAAIITDDDSNHDIPAIQQRVQNIRNLEGANLKVFLSNITLEYELFINNKDLLVEEYKNLHPRYCPNSSDSIEDQAKDFVEKIKTNQDKADFAQLIADQLENTTVLETFVVPEYLSLAIQSVI